MTPLFSAVRRDHWQVCSSALNKLTRRLNSCFSSTPADRLVFSGPSGGEVVTESRGGGERSRPAGPDGSDGGGVRGTYDQRPTAIGSW